MSKEKHDLLKEFLGEAVSILTETRGLVETSGGDLAEASFTVEGMLTDYDDSFILLTTPAGPPELVKITKIVSIRLLDEPEDAFPDAPPRGEFN